MTYSPEYIQFQLQCKKAIANLRGCQIESVNVPNDDYVRELARLRAELAGKSPEECENAGLLASLEAEHGKPAPRPASDFGLKLGEVNQSEMIQQLEQQHPDPRETRSHIPPAITPQDEVLMLHQISQSGFEVGTGERHRWR